jgi:hypothetical protein
MHLATLRALLSTHPGSSGDRDPRRRPVDDSPQEVDDMTDDRSTADALDLVVCPECTAPAEVVDRFALAGTDGPVEHVKVRCVARHWFLLPVASLPVLGVLDDPERVR